MNFAEREYIYRERENIYSWWVHQLVNTHGLTPSNNLSKQMINDIHQWWWARSRLVFSLPDYKNLRSNMWFWTIMLSRVLAEHSYLQSLFLQAAIEEMAPRVSQTGIQLFEMCFSHVRILYPAWHLNTLWTGAAGLGQLTLKGTNTKSEYVAQQPWNNVAMQR